VRRAQYLGWLAAPQAVVLAARDSGRLLEGALRFYRREGAGDYLHTLIMPVR
jgi:hypothetical protein